VTKLLNLAPKSEIIAEKVLNAPFILYFCSGKE
jgi:hypothetical protein